MRVSRCRFVRGYNIELAGVFRKQTVDFLDRRIEAAVFPLTFPVASSIQAALPECTCVYRAHEAELSFDERVIKLIEKSRRRKGMKDARGPVSGAADPISSAELQQEAESANTGLQDEPLAPGGDTHLPASESAALEKTGYGKDHSRGGAATLPGD
jgi:hypothetical protein